MMGAPHDGTHLVAPSPTTASLRLWRELADDPSVFVGGSRHVVRGSRGFCPPGWTGVVRLGDAVVIEAGEAGGAALAALLRLPDPTDPEAVRPLLRGDVLGPACLAYLPDGAMPSGGPSDQVEVATPHETADWLATQPPSDVEASSAADLEAPLVLRRGGRIAGIAGWVRWPASVAHLGVLVDMTHRGTGAGTTLGRAAAHKAVGAGLSPQWRALASNTPSRAIARRLGLVEVGRQLSLQALTAS